MILVQSVIRILFGFYCTSLLLLGFFVIMCQTLTTVPQNTTGPVLVLHTHAFFFFLPFFFIFIFYGPA